MQQNTTVLSIQNLSVAFKSSHQINVLQNINLDISEGDQVCIMGESGCGKSVLGLSIMRLLDDIAHVTGSIKYRGQEIYKMNEAQLCQIRGKKICLIPQNPSSAFNPVIKIGKQIDEMVKHAGFAEKNEVKTVTLECLSKVGFHDPLSIYNTYPHRLSGGMCERALIAMAISTKPDLIIADEPTKGLDVPSKKEVLNLLHLITKNVSMILITHDFRAAATCKRIAIMYSGELVEEGPAQQVLESPKHYYSRGLVGAQPSRGMKPIPGRNIVASHNYKGCKFKNRCEFAADICKEQHPELTSLGKVKVRCHFAQS